MLDTSGWKYFRLDDFLSFEQGKVSVAGDLFDGDDIWYVGAKKESNGIIRKVQVVDELVSRGNCVVFICDGQGSVGYANYIDVDFMGTVNLALGYNKNMTPKRGLFIATVASLERHRFSYGRKWRGKVGATRIKMPVTESNEIDWDWIDAYMAERMEEGCPKTNNVSRKNVVDTSEWASFRVGDLFRLEVGKNKSQADLPPGDDYLYVGAKKKENGVMLTCGYDESIISKGNCIVFICNGQGSVGYTNYMDRDFVATADLVMGYNDRLNKYNGLFLVSVLDLQRPKYSFGRKWKTHLEDTIIKLPIDEHGHPDWKLMEDYMKSLPYGDCI